MPVLNRVAEFQAEIAAIRRDLHMHPEVLFDVHRTAGIVAEKLAEYGCDQVVTGIGVRRKKAGGDMVGEAVELTALDDTTDDMIGCRVGGSRGRASRASETGSQGASLRRCR